jgi:hypothetical protein
MGCLALSESQLSRPPPPKEKYSPFCVVLVQVMQIMWKSVLNKRVAGGQSNVSRGMPRAVELVSLLVWIRVICSSVFTCVHAGCGLSCDGTLIRPYTVCCYGRGSIFLYISSVTTRCSLWLCGTAGCCDELVSGISLRSVRYERACRAVTDVFKFVLSLTFCLWLAVSRPCVCIRMLCASTS